MSPAMPAAPPDPARADLARLTIDRTAEASPRRGRTFLLAGLLAAIVIAVVVFATDLLPFRRPEVQVALARAAETGGGTGGAPVLSASGYVVARTRAAVAPEITGRLVALEVDVGDHVKRGDLIGRLADEDLVARDKEAAAAIASAAAVLSEETTRRDDLRREASRQEELLTKGLAAQATRDAAVTAANAADARVATAAAQLETARATLGVVRAQLAKTRIRAPFDGTVLEKNAELGEVVGPAFGGSQSSGGGVPVVTMADLRSVEVEVDVNETYIQRVAPDMRAEILLDAYPDKTYPASVRQIVPTADRQQATVRVKVRFDAPDERVLPEMGARVSFLAPPTRAPDGAEARTVQVWVPRDAVRRERGETVVWILRADRIVVQAVGVGPTVGGDVQILSGLGPGERVVVGESPAARPGQRVRWRQGGSA